MSGGADSIALAALAQAYFQTAVRAMVIDHRLRAESMQEAAAVQGVLERKGEAPTHIALYIELGCDRIRLFVPYC